MYRFLLRPRWVAFHAVVLAAVVVMVNLGFWQLGRLDERQAFNATVTARIDADPVDLVELLDGESTDPSELEWRSVTVAGTWLAEEQVVVFNRSQGGRAGDNVLTPLRLDDGRLVVVNRGFVPLGEPAPPPTGSGTVEVLGTVRESQVRQRGELTDAAAGEGERVTEIRRVDLPLLAEQLPGPVIPVYLDLVTSRPAVGPADPEPVPLPELDEGPHLSYAVQWFIFAACVVVGWVLAVRRSVGQRRRAAADRASSPQEPPERPRVAGEQVTA